MTQTSTKDDQQYSDLDSENSLWWKLGLLFCFIFVLLTGLYQVHLISSPLEHVYSDMRGYIERAWRLVSGDQLKPYDSFFPSGTTYLYGLIFYSFGLNLGIQILIYLQLFFLAAASVIVGLTSKLIFSSEKLSLFSAALTAIYWPFIAQSSFFVSEAPFIFFLLLAQYLLLLGTKRNFSAISFLTIGILYAFTCLIKGQGLCLFFPALAYLLFKNRLAFVFLIVGFSSLIGPQLYLNHKLSEGYHASLAGNGAYNTYLGQSRSKAVLALDPSKFSFYIFHQNNSFFDEHLGEPELVSAEIINSSFFVEKTLNLWKENPKLQIVRSFQSINELFSLIPAWPMRDIESLRPYQVGFKLAFILTILCPAVLALIVLLKINRFRLDTLLVSTPIILLCGMVFLSMGQPRYLLPFKYNLFILAPIAYWKIYQKFREPEESK